MNQEPELSVLTREQVDRFVAGKIRERRMALGFTQLALAQRLNVTYQQAQKYEKGLNRVSAGRLFEIARVLGVSISYFYEGADEGLPEPEQALLKRNHLELVRNFSRIKNTKHRDALRQLCRSLAEN